MSTSAIADCCISSLEHPITALADRPALSAEDLKAYFDANPLQLMHAHNALAQALTDAAGAKNIGFTGTAGVSASNVQQAIEQVQQQLSDLSSGSVPDGSITTAKLAASLQQQIAAVSQLQTTVKQLQAEQHASGTQFPFMVLALSDDTPETMLDELASAALGLRYTDGVHNLGKQFGWLCTRSSSATPSAAFLAKQTYSDILSDAATLREIASLSPVLTLIKLSAEGLRTYNTALQGKL